MAAACHGTRRGAADRADDGWGHGGACLGRLCRLAGSRSRYAAIVGFGRRVGIGAARRVASLSRIEQTALASERRYRFLAEHSFDMIVRFDPRTQQRLYISPAVRRMYGYEPQEALTMSAEEIIHPDDLSGVRQALAGLEDEPDQPPIL